MKKGGYSEKSRLLISPIPALKWRFCPGGEAGHKNTDISNSPQSNRLYFEQSVGKIKPKGVLKKSGNFNGKHLGGQLVSNKLTHKSAS